MTSTNASGVSLGASGAFAVRSITAGGGIRRRLTLAPLDKPADSPAMRESDGNDCAGCAAQVHLTAVIVRREPTHFAFFPARIES
jgi:hypothetical protein